MASHEITRLLQRAREGEPGALDELMPLVYPELRRIARAFMKRQRPGHTLQPTALINEAFIKLFQASLSGIRRPAHFLALMSRVMRQVLVDHARARVADKRGGGKARVPWDTNIEVGDEEATHQLNLARPAPRARSAGTRRTLTRRRSSRCTISVG